MLTKADICRIAGDAHMAYALDKYQSFEFALAYGIEAAAREQAWQEAQAATLATVTPLVQRERERCAAVCRNVSAEDKAAVERETNSVLRSRFDYGAIVAEECASRILLGNDPAAQPAQAGADRAGG